MSKEFLLHLVQILTAVVLIVSVLFQGGGIGLFGPLGGGESFRTKRGVEKILFYITISAAVIFVLAVFVDLLI